jgi:hypothetical protein
LTNYIFASLTNFQKDRVRPLPHRCESPLEKFILLNFRNGATYSGNPSLDWILIHWYFQAGNTWYIIRIPDPLMNRSEQKKLAQIINQGISAKSEKRRHFRLSLHLPMEYSLPASSRFRLAYMADISEDGLLMFTTEKLDVGQNLSVKFYSASAAGMDCIQAFGKVIRVDNLGKSGKEYRCGVRFSDMQPNFLEKLLNHLKNFY